MSVERAVLLVEGVNGSAGRSVTGRQSHALLPLGRKTVLQVLLDELVSAGAEEICVLMGVDDPAVRQFVDALAGGGALSDDGGGPMVVNLDCIGDGTGGGEVSGLLEARAFVGDEPFMLATTCSPIYHMRGSGSLLRRMTQTLEATGADGVVAVRDLCGSDLSMRTVVEPVGNPGGGPHFVVADLVDRPLTLERRSRTGLINRFVLSPIIFDYLQEQVRGPGEDWGLVTALRRLARDRQALWAVRMSAGEICFDLSSFLLYSRTFIHFSLEDPEVGTAIQEYLRNLVLN
ncbi:MAG: hypothetical protein ACOX9R_04810 [Armatimonadota bacterium]|jgi:UTP--glucose-1-phosphate uridylyltransferase